MERSLGFGLRNTRARLFAVAAILALGGASAEACSAAGNGSTNGAGGVSTEGAGNGQGGISDGVGSLAGSGGSGDGSGNGAGGACATSSVKGKLSPLDIYIMLDQSGSMA